MQQFQLGITSRPQEKYEQPMTKNEIVMVMKQLTDLPRAVTKQMALLKVVRSRVQDRLTENGKQILAEYGALNKSITLYGNAFKKGPISSEGSLLHELAHAFQANMPPPLFDEYKSLSWKAGAGPAGEELLKGKTNFVSPYSMESSVEDFAEHFSEYVNNSERLKTIAPNKYEFLRAKVFSGIEYFSEAAENAKIYLKSEDPDLAPPYLMDALSQFLQISCKAIDAERAEIKIVVVGAMDDVSGISQIDFTLEEPSGGSITFGLGNRDQVTPGVYEKNEILPRKALPPDTFSTKRLHLVDRAGNEAWVPTGETIFFPGTGKQPPRKTEKKPHPLSSLAVVRKLKISAKKAPEGPYYTIDVPALDPQDISWITLNWLRRNSALEETHSFSNEGASDIQIFRDKSMVRLKFLIPKEYPSDTIEVTSVQIQYKRNSIYADDYNRFEFPKNSPNLVFTHKTKQPGLGSPTVDINKIKLVASTDGMNSEGGNASVVAKIPTRNIDLQKFTARVIMRSPQGKRLVGYLEKEMSKGYDDGSADVVVAVKLKPNHEEGEYLLEAIELENRYDNPLYKDKAIKTVYMGARAATEIKLLERGVKVSLTLGPQPSESNPDIRLPNLK